MSASRWSHQRVARGRITPPRAPRHTLLRPRLTQRLLLAQHYRLLLLQAGTGYGKSTALAALAESEQRLVWYHLEGDDADPYVLLLHLLLAWRLFPATSRSIWHDVLRPYLRLIGLHLTSRPLLLAGILLGLSASIRSLGPAQPLRLRS